MTRGRPRGTGKFGETTKAIRVPIVEIPSIEEYLHKRKHEKLLLDAGLLTPDLVGDLSIPVMLAKLPAGFPSPADDYVERRLNPNEYLVDSEPSTFFARVVGTSMIDIGLFNDDIVTVDRSVSPRVGDIVVALVIGSKEIEDGVTVKQLGKDRNGQPVLIPRNASDPTFKTIHFIEGMVLELQGVVISSFRRYRR